MIGRATVLGVWSAGTVLAATSAAEAGDTKPTPPVQVVPQAGSNDVRLERDDLPPPQLEVARHPAKVDTPVIPTFDLPAVERGTHGPRELRVRGKPLLGAELKVRGYVTALYDCAAQLASSNPRVTRAEIDAAIRNDPTLCDRTVFWLGDAHDTPRELSVAVAVPPPDPTRPRPPLPTFSIGDYLIVAGTWIAESSAPERASDPVLRFAAAERASPSAASAPSEPVSRKALEIDLDITAGAPMRKFVDDNTLNTSLAHLQICNKALATKQYDDGIAECREATKIWDGNHLAWYAWASAHIARREWLKARAAIEHAVALRPDQAMYQLYLGIALYEAERDAVREAQAKREHKKPEDVDIDTSALQLGPARDALIAAVRAAPDVWRAHYYLGRVYRDLDEARHAAVQFTQTIKTHPGYRFAYVALIELYRRWDYIDQALAVAMLGTTSVAPAEAGELWYEVGLAHDARRADDRALDAFSKAIAIRPDDAGAKFQRSQIHLRRGDLASARRDLEDVARSADPKLGPIKPLALQILAQLAPTGRHPMSWACSRRSTGTTIVCHPR